MLLEKLAHRGNALLERLPSPLSSELLAVVAQSETILANRLQAMLIDTAVDVTKKSADIERSGRQEALDYSTIGPATEATQTKDLIATAVDVFDRRSPELSDGLLHGTSHGASALAALLRRSSTERKVDEGDLLRDLLISTASLFDKLPEDMAEKLASDLMQSSAPLAVSLRETVLHNLAV